VFFVKGRYFKVGVVWAEASRNSFMELWNFYQGSRILFPGQGTVTSGSRIFFNSQRNFLNGSKNLFSGSSISFLHRLHLLYLGSN
jgi:hypothetical protein